MHVSVAIVIGILTAGPGLVPALATAPPEPLALVEAGVPRRVETRWRREDDALVGTGSEELVAAVSVGEGDFRISARLRMDGQRNSAASFFLDGNHFGFEGARGTVFVSGPLFGGLQLLQPSELVFERGAWIDFEVVRAGGILSFLVDGRNVYAVDRAAGPFATIGFRPMRSTMHVRDFWVAGPVRDRPPPLPRGYSIPHLDLDGESDRQVVVDREPGQYLGHPTTVLLEDGRTIICVYPKGHGRGAIVMKRSTDGGRTWSERLPVPESWATSREVPTIHRMTDPRTGAKRLLVFSGLHPVRRAVSEDDGRTWTPLEPVGDWGGIVAMASVESLRDGRAVALFHDDGRFIAGGGSSTGVFTLYQTFSDDGGLTWGTPEAIWSGSAVHLCEPGIVRSPDGAQLALLLRENSRRRNAHLMLSDDEARTWSPPRELPGALTGDRHVARYAPDGRLLISFRDTTLESPTQGDWVAWVGTYDDIVNGREGQYRVRLKDNHHRWDCAYPAVELLPGGTFVLTTYGHWTEGQPPYILSVRFTLAELDARLPRP
jgi:hypothetical protein